MHNKESSKNYLENLREAGPYMGLGFQLAASILIMLAIGWCLDEKLETQPIFTLILAFFGGFAGIYNFIRAVLKLNEKKKVEKNS